MAYKPVNIVVNKSSGISSIKTDNKHVIIQSSGTRSVKTENKSVVFSQGSATRSIKTENRSVISQSSGVRSIKTESQPAFSQGSGTRGIKTEVSYQPLISQGAGARSIKTESKSVRITFQSGESNASTLRDSALQSHNKFRSMHKNTPMMVWDEQLARGAQEWADRVSKEDKLKHGATGENIFMCCSAGEIDNGKACDKAVESWYSEINNYDYIGRKSVNGKPTGHFTQVVWSSSTKLGVGIAKVQKNNMVQTYVVARYEPPGNMVGAHDKNVFLPKNVPEPVTSSKGGATSPRTQQGGATSPRTQQQTQASPNKQQQQPLGKSQQQNQHTSQKGSGGIKESTLQAHNNRRNQHHNTPMLTWDDELAKGAQQWAQKISKEGKMKHGSKGENIFMCGSSNELEDGKVCEKAVESWYSEIQNYSYNTHQSINDKAVGHFTQVVWASTTKVGVGIAKVKTDGMIKTFLVARYDPPGNMKGSFPQNVNPSKGSANQTAGLQPIEVQVKVPAAASKVNGPSQNQSGSPPAQSQPSSSKIKDATVQAHNKQRSLHKNTPMLTWDDELAKGAQKWARKICKEGKMKHGSKGENIFMCCSSGDIDEGVACERAVQSWYSEIKDYDFTKHASTSSNPIGHFTQVVWASSQTVGIGIAKAKADGMIKTFVVARYGPPGNMQGAYPQNVNMKK